MVFEWCDARLAQAYDLIDKVKQDNLPEPETWLRSTLDNALSNIEMADQVIAADGKYLALRSGKEG